MKTKRTKSNLDQINIGSAYFVSESRMLTDSLFTPQDGKTASGLFRICAHSVTFMQPDGTPFACLVMNRHGNFFVSCSRQPDGRIRYMHALNWTLDGPRLGMAHFTYAEKQAEAERIAALVKNA